MKEKQRLILTRSIKSSDTSSVKRISCDSLRNKLEYWRDLPEVKASMLVVKELGFSDVSGESVKLQTLQLKVRLLILLLRSFLLLKSRSLLEKTGPSEELET